MINSIQMKEREGGMLEKLALNCGFLIIYHFFISFLLSLSVPLWHTVCFIVGMCAFHHTLCFCYCFVFLLKAFIVRHHVFRLSVRCAVYRLGECVCMCIFAHSKIIMLKSCQLDYIIIQHQTMFITRISGQRRNQSRFLGKSHLLCGALPFFPCR